MPGRFFRRCDDDTFEAVCEALVSIPSMPGRFFRRVAENAGFRPFPSKFQSLRCQGASSGGFRGAGAEDPGRARFNPFDARALLQAFATFAAVKVTSRSFNPFDARALLQARPDCESWTVFGSFNPFDARALLQANGCKRDYRACWQGFNPFDARALLQASAISTQDAWKKVPFQSLRCQGASSGALLEG